MTLSMTAQSLPRLDCRGASSAKTCMGLGKAEIKKKNQAHFPAVSQVNSEAMNSEKAGHLHGCCRPPEASLSCRSFS